MNLRLVTSALLACGTALADGAPRQHVLTPTLQARLPSAVKKNAAAVGGWRTQSEVLPGTGPAMVNEVRGTVVLVGRRGRRGLFLTNDHVLAGMESMKNGFGSIQLGDDEIPVRRVTSRDEGLDYALVSATLPVGFRMEPARFASWKSQGAVYRISGEGSPEEMAGARVVVTGRNRQAFTEMTDGAPARSIAGSPGVTARPTWLMRLFGPSPTSLRLAMPTSHGNSGSPIFGADTHEIVALVHSKLGTDRTVATDIDAIRRDLRDKLATGTIAGADAVVVRDVIEPPLSAK